MNKIKKIFLIFLLLKLTICNGTGFKINTENDKKKEKQHLSYSGGTFAGIGAMTGLTFANGHGFYIDARCNRHVLKKTQYFFDGSAINDHTLSWVYDDIKIYSRWEANAGGIFRLYQNKNGMALKMYIGGGILKPRYLYSFKRTAGADIQHAWVEYREISKLTYNTELGICFYIKESFNIQLGLSSLTKKYERMLTFGVGTGLYKHYQ